MAQEDWRATIQSLALEVQEEAENLRWLGRRDGPEATTSEREEAQEEPQRKKRKGKGKGQSPRKVGKNYKVVKKYALNFEKRLMQVIGGSDFVEGQNGKQVHDLEDLLSLCTTALHTQDPEHIKEVKKVCRDLSRDREPEEGETEDNDDDDLWVQEILCKAYCAKTVLRKMRGWRVQ